MKLEFVLYTRRQRKQRLDEDRYEYRTPTRHFVHQIGVLVSSANMLIKMQLKAMNIQWS